MKQVGIIGGGGYTAGELIRILQHHPAVEIAYIYSNSQQGKPVSEVHEDLIGEVHLDFSSDFHFDLDVLFLCMGHGRSATFLTENPVPDQVAIIDLSRDYRLSESYVYGLPELNKTAIQETNRIANCGCFATTIQLGLLPLASVGDLSADVQIHAITGSTGAGQSPKPTTHFSWRNNNLSIYKAFQHQHLDEIKRSILQLQGDFNHNLNFLPLRGDFPRGIFASLYTQSSKSLEELYALYEAFYADHPFTIVTRRNPNLKQVVNTNKCLVYLEKHEDKVLIISMIDNLLKGASGQAVQNMNLVFGWEETLGLQLKALAF
ncbi:MAG: N-acetyl-gamma-glutamyl-phosphate reductase [Saprospiraceae bacterium]